MHPDDFSILEECDLCHNYYSFADILIDSGQLLCSKCRYDPSSNEIQALLTAPRPHDSPAACTGLVGFGDCPTGCSSGQLNQLTRHRQPADDRHPYGGEDRRQRGL